MRVFFKNILLYTVTRKNMNLPYSIRMYWTNFLPLSVHVQQNIFEITHIEVGSSNLYASFVTLWVQIGQLFEAQWDFKLSKEFEIDVIFLQKRVFYRFKFLFKDSLCLEKFINLDAKEAYRHELSTSIKVFFSKISCRTWTVTYQKSVQYSKVDWCFCGALYIRKMQRIKFQLQTRWKNDCLLS